MIGPILNPVVLRFDLSGDPTFAELIAQARERVLEGHANQEVPFERVVQEVSPERSLLHPPLFQVAVVLHNAPDASLIPITGGGAVYDLTLFAVEGGTTLGTSYEYRADMYERDTVRRIAGHLQHALAAAAQNRTLRVSELPLLGEDERLQISERFNDTRTDIDETTVVEQFTRAVAARPDEIAIVAADRSLTYGALDRLSTALAARLRSGGAGAGSFVALAVDRSSALPVAALGILKSGAGYVPVDLEYPRDRVALMLCDSGVRQIVTTRAMAASPAFAGTTAAIHIIDELDAEGETRAAGLVPSAASDPTLTDIAYLIYTSGSTGTPKGVLVPHSAVSNFLQGMRNTIGCSAADVLFSVTSPSFDISVLELFLPLVLGGRIVIADRETISDGHRFARALTESGASMVQSTPSGWRLLMNAGWQGNAALRAIVGGEPLPPALAQWLRPRVRELWNAYGPTETTVWSTMALITEDEPITIGIPIANTRVYVLDAHERLAPIGVAGEIYIAGAGVARGYHQRSDLTAERFVPDCGAAGATMYRTGDIGRWRRDGRLEHLGRVDGQVKVRGHRIETGEIEAVLASHAAVQEAVVGVRDSASEDPRLVAWVRLHEDEACTASELRQHLRQRLPEFMIPSMIVPIETFPLTPNGKIDRRALPDAFVNAYTRGDEGAPPTTPTERIIADIWMRLLSVDRLAVTDRFFELGGHSLLAMRAANEIAARTGRVIDPRLLFFRTLGQLAEACDGLPVTSGLEPHMNLLFFGSSCRQLYGAYHAPSPIVSARGAAVLCPPWGSEYLASHRILRRLAARLSDSGYHVLRFDYYGSGDSAGRRDEGDLETWCADASVAVDELRDMSGCQAVVSCGIRLGANVGWRLAQMRPDVAAVMMWDPVVIGVRYVRELVEVQEASERWFLTPRPKGASLDGRLNLLGFPMTPAMRQSIEVIAPAQFAKPTAAPVTLLYSEMPAGVEELHRALESGGTRFQTEVMLGQPPWRETKTIVNGGMPFAVVERLVELLK